MFKIFDLDATLIDSSHRTKNALNDDGSFNLKKYFKYANSDELIFNDSLLPLAKYAQQLARTGEQFCILTARTFKDADRIFLLENGLINNFTIVLDRSTVAGHIRLLSDPDYKRFQFNKLERLVNAKSFIFFDDNPSIIREFARDENIHMVDAIGLNEELTESVSDSQLFSMEREIRWLELCVN